MFLENCPVNKHHSAVDNMDDAKIIIIKDDADKKSDAYTQDDASRHESEITQR